MRSRAPLFLLVVLVMVWCGFLFDAAEERGDSLGVVGSGLLLLMGVALLVRVFRDQPLPDLTVEHFHRLTGRFRRVAVLCLALAGVFAVPALSSDPLASGVTAVALLLLGVGFAIAAVTSARIVRTGEVPKELQKQWERRRQRENS